MQRLRARQRRQTASVFGDEQRPRVTAMTQIVGKAQQMAFRKIAQIGVDDDRHRAAILARLRRNLMREIDRQMSEKAFRVLLPDQRPDPNFMKRIDKRVERDDDDPPHPLINQILDLFQHLLFAQRDNHLAEVVDPLLDPNDQRLWHQGLRPLGATAIIFLLGRQAVAPITRAPDFDGVLEALRRDEPEPGAAPLDQGIGADGRGIDDTVRRLQGFLDLEPSLIRRHTSRVEEADLKVVVTGIGLTSKQGAVVDADDIGKRAADVDAEANAHERLSRRVRFEVMLAA